MTALLALLLLLSMLGVRAQETMQLLLNATTVHYGLVYVALFALPLIGTAGFRTGIPPRLRRGFGGGPDLQRGCCSDCDLPNHRGFKSSVLCKQDSGDGDRQQFAWCGCLSRTS